MGSSANLVSEKSAAEMYSLVKSKIESRDFASDAVPDNIIEKILDAARLTGSGMNAQHWRFVLVKDGKSIKRLAADSTTGGWVINANFAVIVLTDPKYAFHLIDAGRAIQSMMLTAWGFKVASGIYVGIKAEAMLNDFKLPTNLNISAVLGFGYPKQKILGNKDRKPLSEVAFLEQYGRSLQL